MPQWAPLEWGPVQYPRNPQKEGLNQRQPHVSTLHFRCLKTWQFKKKKKTRQVRKGPQQAQDTDLRAAAGHSKGHACLV